MAKINQKLSPKLRFGNSKKPWDFVLLDEIATRGSGHTPSKSHPEYYRGTIPWVSLADSDKLDAGFINRTKYTISQEGIKNSSAVLHSKGTVLLSRDAGVGKSAVMGEDMAVSQHFITWTCSERLNNWYLYYYLQKQKRELERISVGSTIKTIGLPYFRKLHIPLPPRDEQNKIGNTMLAVDEWLSSLRQQKLALVSYRKGIMHKLFTQQIRFKDADGGEFPAWKKKKLGDVFDQIKGTGLSKESLSFDGGLPCILYGELYTTYNEVIGEVKSKTHINEGTPSKIGDLLLPSSTTTTAIDLAKVSAINQEGVLLGGDITILRAKFPVCNAFYSYYLTNFKKQELAKFGQGVTIIHIYYSHFKEMLIDVPDKEEQHKITEFISSVDALIESKLEQIKQAEKWKRGLMQQMFV